MFDFNWQSFVSRPDISRLPLNEQKRLYILEEQAFNARINYYLSMFSSTPSGITQPQQQTLIIPNPLDEEFTILSGQTYTVDGTFTINSGGILNIQDGGVFIVNGSVVNEGVINNEGTYIINGEIQ
jgi:hypothetical protein